MRIDSLHQTGRQINALNVSELLGRLNIGDVIKAQVVEAAPKELLLKLPDGTLLTAATMNDHDTLKGEFVKLLVNGKDSNQVFMEIIKNKSDNYGRTENGLTQDNILTKLLSNGIEPVEKNINTLNKLISGKLMVGEQLDELLKLFECTIGCKEEEMSALKRDIESLFVQMNSENEHAAQDFKNINVKILAKLEQLKAIVSSSSQPGALTIAEHMQSVESSIKFIDNLNNYNAYVQIPIDINDKKTTVEMYVLKKGRKRRRIDPENASLLISLSTHNLGLVESLININKKNINISMRVENEEIIGFLKENYRHLFNSLVQKGYKPASVRYSIIKKKTTILDSAEELKNEFEDMRSTFDYRV
jgi:hypothetical protein